jgi:hypothetical protein
VLSAACDGCMQRLLSVRPASDSAACAAWTVGWLRCDALCAGSLVFAQGASYIGVDRTCRIRCQGCLDGRTCVTVLILRSRSNLVLGVFILFYVFKNYCFYNLT